MREQIQDVGFNDDFLCIRSKEQENINVRCKYIKLKNLLPKDTINKLKRQPRKWENIFAKHLSDKGLIARIYKEQNSTTSKLINNGQIGPGWCGSVVECWLANQIRNEIPSNSHQNGHYQK